jgi:Na+-translocating ferredoxin:NAD+ oxidoreductase subunit B
VHSPTLADSLAERIDAALPQTQCTRCGYADCRAYAEAIAGGEARINQCPPGGAEGIARLAAITGQDVIALNPGNGAEGPRKLMFIDEAWCIGCTLCITACPVDCIVGAEATPGQSGWNAWSEDDADRARSRYAAHRARAQRNAQDNDVRLAEKAKHKLADLAAASSLTDPVALDRKRVAIEAAMQRARERADKSA